jgi:riboflavin synthase
VFTGIVEELGEVVTVDRRRDSARIRIRAATVTADAAHGDSIAVDGVCLTVADVSRDGAGGGEFTADVMPETLDRTSLGTLAPGHRVNLERPMTLGGRLGGHLVQGHVDGTGQILERVPGERWEVVRISLPAGVARYVVEKGSIAVDGVSLTVAGVTGTDFTVSLIPTTLALTTLGHKQPGETVNLEVDVIAKYVERLGSYPASEKEAIA